MRQLAVCCVTRNTTAIYDGGRGMNTNHGKAIDNRRYMAAAHTKVKTPRNQLAYWQSIQREMVFLFNKRQRGSARNKTYARLFMRMYKYERRCIEGSKP